jgi:hypothetical protein
VADSLEYGGRGPKESVEENLAVLKALMRISIIFVNYKLCLDGITSILFKFYGSAANLRQFTSKFQTWRYYDPDEEPSWFKT